jgi:hypothetical protein
MLRHFHCPKLKPDCMPIENKKPLSAGREAFILQKTFIAR